MRDPGHVHARLAIEPRHRVGHAQVQPLTPQLRNRRRQHLAGQLVREAPRDVASSRGAGHDAGPLRFVERRHQRVAVDVGDLFEQVRFEMTSDHRRGFAQHALPCRRHALQPALQHDAHRVRELDIIQVEIARPAVRASNSRPSSFRCRNSSTTKNGLPPV